LDDEQEVDEYDMLRPAQMRLTPAQRIQTDCADSKTFNEMQWDIKPVNTPVLTIEPPRISAELAEVEREEALPGEIDWVPVSFTRTIDTLTHHDLLNSSLAKHGDIWKTLAER